MSPIIEVRKEKKPGRKDKWRTMLVCRNPISGGILRRQQLNDKTMSDSVIAQKTIDFTIRMMSWFNSFHSLHLVSKCEDFLL